MRTVADPVEGTEVRVEPAETDGITVAGVPADLDHVAKADVRVDLADDGVRTFVVEHALGALGLCGITAARVTGVRDAWDFARPEHRFCYSTGLGPEHVVGHPAGLPNPALARALGGVETVVEGERPRTTVTERVHLSNRHGEIALEPREYGAGIRFELEHGEAAIEATVDPAGENDPDLVEAVTTSTTPYLGPDDEEAVTHSVADFVSDVAVVGSFDDLVVTGEIAGATHTLTVGAARKAHEAGVVESRTG